VHGHEVTVKAAESLMEGTPGSPFRLLVSKPEHKAVQPRKLAAAAPPPAPVDVPEPKIVYVDKIVERVVTVEKPVEKIVEKIITVEKKVVCFVGNPEYRVEMCCEAFLEQADPDWEGLERLKKEKEALAAEVERLSGQNRQLQEQLDRQV
jgi:hypothetical protein